VDFAVVRPSQDLGQLAAEYEPELPRGFRFLTRSLGTRETSNADFLSLLMFVPEYLERLIAMGEADAEARIEAIERVAKRSARLEPPESARAPAEPIAPDKAKR